MPTRTVRLQCAVASSDPPHGWGRLSEVKELSWSSHVKGKRGTQTSAACTRLLIYLCKRDFVQLRGCTNEMWHSANTDI
jgi:hypothetical protein